MSQNPIRPTGPSPLGAGEAGLVLAIISIFLCQPLGIVALVFAILAMTNATGEALRYAGYAKTAAGWGIGLGLA